MMKLEKLVELYVKADEESREAAWRLVRDPEKYMDIVNAAKGGDIDAKEMKKLILERT